MTVRGRGRLSWAWLREGCAGCRACCAALRASVKGWEAVGGAGPPSCPARGLVPCRPPPYRGPLL
eukprot:1189693-Prorocentrum_minimum.AAC.2